MPSEANLRADAFVGTAQAYLRYRPPYPRAMLADLVAQVRPGPAAKLVDLACGPGRVCLDLAPSFEMVLAVDLEPEMIDTGRSEAARRGIGNVDWRVCAAEELDLPANSVDLITIGEAFHRLDQPVIAAKALAWLKPGGCLVTLGARGHLDGPEPWQLAVAAVARRWMARAFPEGVASGRAGAEVGPGAPERVLRRAGFQGVDSVDVVEPRDWSFDAILGYLKSTSVCSDNALGRDAPAFETELRAALGEADVFHEDFLAGYPIGRKPRGTP